VKLLSKRGGKSDFTITKGRRLRAAVLVMSDSVSAGKKKDESGKLIVERLKSLNVGVVNYAVIPDDAKEITKKLLHYADGLKLDLVITTGGTGLGPRDNTPEAVRKIIEREIPGISETVRAFGQERMPFAMLSRGVAGVRGKTIFVSLPGSKSAVSEGLDAMFPALLHAFNMLKGEGHLHEN
jgi:molybdenum cofactor synthesis domain-containing protein